MLRTAVAIRRPATQNSRSKSSRIHGLAGKSQEFLVRSFWVRNCRHSRASSVPREHAFWHLGKSCSKQCRLLLRGSLLSPLYQPFSISCKSWGARSVNVNSTRISLIAPQPRIDKNMAALQSHQRLRICTSSGASLTCKKLTGPVLVVPSVSRTDTVPAPNC